VVFYRHKCEGLFLAVPTRNCTVLLLFFILMGRLLGDIKTVTKPNAKRSLWVNIFGQGFDFPRLH